MWTSDRTRSFLALGLLCALLVATDAVIAAIARRHYLPARKLQSALALSRLDALLVGDSRMAAAIDLPSFEAGWQDRTGSTPVLADLSLGWTDLAGQVVTVRRFFDRGGVRTDGPSRNRSGVARLQPSRT